MDASERKLEATTRMGSSPRLSISSNESWDGKDSLLVAVLFLGTLLVLVRGVRWHGLPAEDALMLLRYARHLADGFGIVWNIGDHPVEGATDFLYLIALTGWIKLSHLGPIWASRTLLAACHLLGVVLLYSVSRITVGTGRLLAFILCVYYAMGPGVVHVSNGFSSPFYALMALAAWSFACSSVVNGITDLKIIGFASFALLTGLTRPDGVLLAIFMTLAIAFALRRASLRLVLATVLVFLVLGGGYFLWRFHYFGYLLPNPFYRKGGGHLYLGSLKASITDVIKLLLPFLPFFALGLVAPRARQTSLFALIPIAGFSIIWVLLSNENNAGMRFQYVVLPIGLLSIGLIARQLQLQLRELNWTVTWPHKFRVASFVLVLAFSGIFYFYWKAIFPIPEEVGTGPYHIAVALSKYASRNYTLVATESGVIPYFSRWRTIDGWGLNDAEIVHNPHGLTSAYLDKAHPAIIMMYSSVLNKEDFDRVWRGDAPPSESTAFLMDQASHYARTHNYTLAARWGIMPCSVNIWYLRRDLPEYNDVLAILRQQPNFHPYDDAALATNFLDDAPPANCSDDKHVVNPQD